MEATVTVWYKEPISQEEIVFESGVFLLNKTKAETLKTKPADSLLPDPPPLPDPDDDVEPDLDTELPEGNCKMALQLAGTVPSEAWNRFGTTILPKLHACDGLHIQVELSVNVSTDQVRGLERSLQQILDDLEVSDRVRISKKEAPA